MGLPLFWRHPKNGLKKCSERTRDNCTDHDDCCAVVACSYCLEFVAYDGTTYYGLAEMIGDQWFGTIAGAAFHAYWERDYYTDVCEFVVTIDDAEVYRAECYGSVTCRNSSDEVAATIGYDEGTLTWTKVDKLPLPHVVDPDTGCKTWFCGDCECTCEALCATLITAAPDCCTVEFTIPATSYVCDSPTWEATAVCGVSHDVSVSLSRNEYGDCQVGGSVNGEALTAQTIADCVGWTAVFNLYDGSTLTVVCRVCDCAATSGCVVGCCWPLAFTELYPCGYQVPIPFEISATGCDLDGYTDNFTPVTATARGTCGGCGGAPPVVIGTTIGTLKVEVPGFGYCNDTPCSIDVVLMLTCDDSETVPYGLDECCGKLRLWVGTSVRLAGDVGLERPEGAPTGYYWLKIEPSSCSCLPDSGGFAAIFEVTIVLDCPTLFTTGPCIDEPKDCCDPFCGGFTLTI